MRGGSQAQLVEGSDGKFYVAKFLGNPQGNRTLVNELVAHQLLRVMGISTPPLRLLNLPNTAEFDQNAYFLVGAKRIPAEPGRHLGSLCPVNPEKVAIFDLLPVRLLSLVGNIEEFATTFVMDKWLYNADRRQVVYFRDRSQSPKVTFRACFIDQGMSFGGSLWEFGDVAGFGLAESQCVYSQLDMAALAERAINRIKAIAESTISAAGDCVPREWLAEGDADCLARLLGQLASRRSRLDSLVRRHLAAIKGAAPLSLNTHTATGSNFPRLRKSNCDSLVIKTQAGSLRSRYAGYASRDSRRHLIGQTERIY
jgi:hypothetical protein